MQKSPLILSCDWGSTTFRLRLVDTATGQVHGELRTPDGIGAIIARSPAGESRVRAFRQHLNSRTCELYARLGMKWNGVPLFISGMASASIGLKELPYAALPVDLDGRGIYRERLPGLSFNAEASCSQAELPMYLISGLTTGSDVLRGEEMEILGVMNAPEYTDYQQRAILVLPGTHAKHVQIRDSHIVSFSTYLTGELFSVLTRHSVLSHSVQVDEEDDNMPPAEFDRVFREGVEDACRLPILHALFRVRARHLLEHSPPSLNRRYLSGLLIGAEMQGLLAGSPRDWPVLLCADSELAALYARALAVLDAEECLVVVPPEIAGCASTLGHLALYRLMTEDGIDMV
jgi:2-dehydro-3-deoxygalactonokinase